MEDKLKEPISKSFKHFKFESCVDLSLGVKISPLNNDIDLLEWEQKFANDVACFTAWWIMAFQSQIGSFNLGSIEFKLVK